MIASDSSTGQVAGSIQALERLHRNFGTQPHGASRKRRFIGKRGAPDVIRTRDPLLRRLSQPNFKPWPALLSATSEAALQKA